MKCVILYHVSYWLCDHLVGLAVFLCPVACRMRMDGPLDPPTSVSRKAPTRRIRCRVGVGGGGEGQGSAVTSRCCKSASCLTCEWERHWLSAAPLILHEHSQGDKPGETEVRPSENLRWCWITRFTWLYPLIFSVLNSPRLSWLRLNWQFKQGVWELQECMWHSGTLKEREWRIVHSLFWLCTINCAQCGVHLKNADSSFCYIGSMWSHFSNIWGHLQLFGH